MSVLPELSSHSVWWKHSCVKTVNSVGKTNVVHRDITKNVALRIKLDTASLSYFSVKAVIEYMGCNEPCYKICKDRFQEITLVEIKKRVDMENP